MVKEKVLSTREWIKILERNGYQLVSSNGSHLKYKKKGDMIVVTHHPVNRMIVRRMVKEHSIQL